MLALLQLVRYSVSCAFVTLFSSQPGVHSTRPRTREGCRNMNMLMQTPNDRTINKALADADELLQQSTGEFNPNTLFLAKPGKFPSNLAKYVGAITITSLPGAVSLLIAACKAKISLHGGVCCLHYLIALSCCCQDVNCCLCIQRPLTGTYQQTSHPANGGKAKLPHVLLPAKRLHLLHNANFVLQLPVHKCETAGTFNSLTFLLKTGLPGRQRLSLCATSPCR